MTRHKRLGSFTGWTGRSSGEGGFGSGSEDRELATLSISGTR
jgi:hypothetical protein